MCEGGGEGEGGLHGKFDSGVLCTARRTLLELRDYEGSRFAYMQSITTPARPPARPPARRPACLPAGLPACLPACLSVFSHLPVAIRRDLEAIIASTSGPGKAAKEAQKQLVAVGKAETEDRKRERETFGRAFAMVASHALQLVPLMFPPAPARNPRLHRTAFGARLLVHGDVSYRSLDRRWGWRSRRTMSVTRLWARTAPDREG